MTDSMPDAKRKLPVLLLLREDIAAHCDAGPIYAYTSVYGAPAQGSGDSETHALCEPAVPRCRTCPHFTKDWEEDSDRSWYYCPELESDEPFPQDGSGYCFMHPEAQCGL